MISQKFVANNPNTVVIGQTMVAFVENLRADEITPIMAQHELSEIDPMAWYPQQKFLDVYRDIEEKYGAFSEALVAIGAKTIDTIDFPPEVTTIEQALDALTGMYQGVHQHANPAEGWVFERISEDIIQADFNSPYSDSAAFGYLHSISRRFAPEGKRCIVHLVSQATESTPTRFHIRFLPAE